MSKEKFLQAELVKTISGIAINCQPAWGKMNLQQMTEHISRDAFRVASGKVTFPLMTPEEHIPKMQRFIMSDMLFKENTVNRLMAAEPVPEVHTDITAALTELQTEIDDFFAVYKEQPELKIVNPFFGALTYEMQVNLLHKHALHHLRQFHVVL